MLTFPFCEREKAYWIMIFKRWGGSRRSFNLTSQPLDFRPKSKLSSTVMTFHNNNNNRVCRYSYEKDLTHNKGEKKKYGTEEIQEFGAQTASPIKTNISRHYGIIIHASLQHVRFWCVSSELLGCTEAQQGLSCLPIRCLILFGIWIGFRYTLGDSLIWLIKPYDR